MDEDHWVFLTCLTDVHTMRELRDEGGIRSRERLSLLVGLWTKKMKIGMTMSLSLLTTTSLEAGRDEMVPVSTHGTGGAFPRRRRGAIYTDGL